MIYSLGLGHLSTEKLESIVSQANSWSRLRISQDMFCLLCQFYSTFPAFLDLVMELGFKTSDIEDNCATCYRRIHLSEEDSSIEIYGSISTKRDYLSD